MLRLSPLLLMACLVSTAHAVTVVPIPDRVVVSVRDQKLMVLKSGAKVATYPVSTSKFGVGDNSGRMTTPLGLLQVAKKIGELLPVRVQLTFLGAHAVPVEYQGRADEYIDLV